MNIPNTRAEPSGSVGRVKLGIKGLLVQDFPESLCCVLDQDTLSSGLTQEDRRPS